MEKHPSLAEWTPEQIAQGRRWAQTWKLAAEDLERLRRKEIRELDTYKTIAILCGTADYTRPPYAPEPWSGLVEQQRWFKKAAGRE
ncbi:MAG TPA: hypothetical protein VGJ37_03415 [Pyrinomonadaceae bacterium]